MSFSPHRGQLNFEYLVLTGILLAVLTPLIYTSLTTFYESYKTTRLEDMISQIAYKANDVYKLGPGNKDSVNILVPPGITGASVAGNEISYQTTLGKQNTSVRKFTEVEVIGSLDTVQGQYLVPIKSINSSLVRIGSGPLLFEITPGCIGAPGFANPQNITLSGDDFTATSVLQKDGADFDPTLYQIIDTGTIVFVAHPTQFTARPTGPPFVMRVVDKGKTSNSKDFLVYPNSNLCP